jgi:DHA1 family bicyclomycin/chloramphenicol resistance-like MFS transporter
MALGRDSRGLVLLLGALAALPSLAIDAVSPTFPALQLALGASPEEAGFTVAFFMAGLALAQLLLGPASDLSGRRPVLLAGLVLFTAASAGCALTDDIWLLIGCRAIGGFGAGSGTVIALAVIRDLFDGEQARRKLSFVNVVFGISPLLAPSLGSILLMSFGWRSTYGSMALAGAALIVAAVLGLPRPPVRARSAIRSRSLIAGRLSSLYAVVLKNRAFRIWVTLDALSFGCMFSFVAGSALLFMDGLGVNAAEYSAIFASTAAGCMMGAWTNGWLAARGLTTHRALDIGCALATTASLLLVVAQVAQIGGEALLAALFIIVLFCRGLIMPSVVQAAFEPLAVAAGAASGVLGFLKICAGAMASLIVSVLFELIGALAVVVVTAGFATAASAHWWLVARRFSATPSRPDR